MFQIHEHSSVEEASQELFPFIANPRNWVALEQLSRHPDARPGENAAYQRQVGALRICASVDVTDGLQVFLRIAFRAPGLTPTRAADHLDSFLKQFIPMLPQSEWQVQVDGRKWIHFIRRYGAEPLRA